MRNSLLVGASLLCLCLGAEAQENLLHFDPASRETVLGSALWLNSTNSAGMSLDSLFSMSDLSLKASYADGGLKSVWSGESETDVKVSTSGITRLHGLTLYGDFSYNYIAQKNASYNCILYEPSYDQPFYVADFVDADWKKQAYDMGFRLASPLFFGGRAAFGLEARYKDLVGAKQRDPRTETFRYDISVAPSAVFTFGRGTLGLKLSYLHSFERSKPSTENYLVDPKVAIMRGLGFYTLGTANPNSGIDIFYYKTNRYGADMQYALHAPSADVIFDAGASFGKTTVSENVTVPRMRGRTEKLSADLSITANLGAARNHRIRMDASYGNTSGIEYNQKFDNTPGAFKWVTLSEQTMSAYNILNADASYTWYKGLEGEGGYDFKLGADAVLFYMTQDYYVPASSFNAFNAVLSAFGGWNIALGERSTLLPDFKVGYRYSPSGEYIYGGSTNKDSQIVTDMYPSELAFLTSDCLKGEAGVTWALKMKAASTLAFSLRGGYDYSFSMSHYRLAVSLGASLLF